MEPRQSSVAVIDDDISFREAVTGLVASFGFRAEAFVSAQTFLRSGRVPGWGCLIVDVEMPEMNGLELQATLARCGMHIPIIFVTSFPDERRRKQALKAGAIDVLSKPCDREILLQHICTALTATR